MPNRGGAGFRSTVTTVEHFAHFGYFRQIPGQGVFHEIVGRPAELLGARFEAEGLVNIISRRNPMVNNATQCRHAEQCRGPRGARVRRAGRSAA